MQLSLDRARPAPPAAAGPGAQTWLVTPGITPTRFASAVGSGAEAVLLDLEDSVPAEAKAGARESVLTFAGRCPPRGAGPLLGVRINSVDTPEGLRDLTAMADRGLWPDLVVVPKVESGDVVASVVQSVHAARAATRVWALIESPRAVLALPDIVRTPGLAGVLFGAADYAAAAGCRITPRAMWYPRSQLVTAAAAAGIPAVDSPHFSPDPGELRRETLEAVELGFAGKVAVHPRQLPVIAQAFAPSPQELETARAVLAAATGAGGRITTVGGAMVGPPLVEAARAVVRRAERVAGLTAIPTTEAS
ncbi:HpcH/HpaI aldolase/citrate lyase family protein [Kitasatospora sp. NPDC088783]|uniref:HpcH/HpaI aldolase/citrate lyase family protein n=1 Tax=Kitasatospora sp. NPDC088783 TaxID=3364077 RepID=UPI00381CA4FA